MQVDLSPQPSRPPSRRKHSLSNPAIMAGILSAAAPLIASAASQPETSAAARVAESSAVESDADESRLHVSFGTDYTNAYFFRGFAYEDTGPIIQPWAAFSLDVLRGGETTVSLHLETWNSFHGQATDAGTSDDFRKYWFESDITAGVGVEFGVWTLAAVYNWYTSPSDAFETTEEVMFTGLYEDDGLLPCGWTLLPQIELAIETGSVANDGGRKGAFLELGVSPGFEFDVGEWKELDLRFPVRVGLSLSNYYEGENGENDAFGFASAGAEITVPLGLDESWGDWSITAGIRGLFLGDAAATYNGDDDFQLIGNVGIAVEF